MFQAAPANQVEFLQRIQQVGSTNFIYPLNDFINAKSDFFIGKKGGPDSSGTNYYIGPSTSEQAYMNNVRDPVTGIPANPSPFRLNLKVAVLIDPSGPVVNNRPNHFFVAHKKHTDRRTGRVSNSTFRLRTNPSATYYYCDFPKGSVTEGQVVNKITSGDITTPLDSWPQLRELLVAACYSEVREEGRLSELDWRITGVYPRILVEGHDYRQNSNIHSWNLFFVFFGTITDHIRLYTNAAGSIPRQQAANSDTLAKELTARAEANFLNPSLNSSYKERGTIEVVTPGTTDINTWLKVPSHESLIYTELLGLV